MPEYSYRFANLLSDSDVAELELSNVKFDRRIIIPGSFSGTVAVTNLDIATQVKKIIPAKTIVHVYRDADIWGTYIIWSMRVRSTSRGPVTVEFTGASLESWFYHRIIDVDLNFTFTDQFEIARQLVYNGLIGWNPYAAAANLHINLDDNMSGVQRDRTYKLSEAASIGQRLEELANVENGFEYMINTYVDTETNTRERDFVIDQFLGDENGDFVFTYPGAISGYEVNYDASDAATAWWARGDTVDTDVIDNEEPLITEAPFLAGDWLSSGFPHLDKVLDRSGVVVLAHLQVYAEWWRDNRSGVWAVPVIDINTTDVPTIITPAQLGSTAQFTILDEFFGITDEVPDFSYRNRVIGIEVSPPERGRPETMRLVIEQVLEPGA
jgi:hypothetical protein